MTMAEAGEIFSYWERNPPTYQLVAVIARMLGWKPDAAAAPDDDSASTLADIAASPPPGLAVAGDLGMPEPLLDLDAFREKNRARMLEIAQRNQRAAAG